MPSAAHRDGRASTGAARELRGKILKEHEEARRNRDLLVQPGRKELSETIVRLDNLANQVERPREQADESDAFCFVSGKGAEMAKAMGLAGQGRTPRDCIRRLVAIYANTEQIGQVQDPKQFAWKRLAQEVCLLKRHAPGMSCMLGPLEAEAKVRRVGQRQEKTKVGRLQQPDTLEASEEGVKQDSDQVLEDLWAVLEQHSNISLLQLVLNYDSFSQTVENLFQLSFLVRDGHVSVADSEEGLVVSPVAQGKKAKGKQRAEGGTEMTMRLQFVLGFDMADWEDWKSHLRREDCLMRHRQPKAPAGGTPPNRRDRPDQDGDGRDNRTKRPRQT